MATPNSNPTLTRVIPLAIVLLAAGLRLPLLELKPPHFDEGVNGFFVDQITHTGLYRYDPANFHGPLHMYVLFLFQTLFGRHLWALRLPVVLTSLASVWLITRFDRFLDRRTCWFAALALAVSPAMIFYARYAIHESELVFFLLLLVWGIAGLWQFGQRTYLWCTGLALAGLLLTKETYTVHLVCFVLAVPCVVLLQWLSPATYPARARQQWTQMDLAVVLAVAIGLVVFFYSCGLFDPSALDGLWQTYAKWFVKGTAEGGEGHGKDWWYWLRLMARCEQPALLGLLCTPLLLWRRQNGLLRYLAFYGAGALAAYSLIKYKTPWCIVSLLWPFYFVLGAGISMLAKRIGKGFFAGASILCVIGSGVLAVRLNFVHFTDEKEPYVYVQTYRDIEKLTSRLFSMTTDDPRAFSLSGNIVVSSYHPLVWWLADFPRVTFYDEKQVPEEVDADFLLIENERIDELEPKLKGSYFTEMIRVRDGMEPARLYFSYSQFRRFFPNQVPDFPSEGSKPNKVTP